MTIATRAAAARPEETAGLLNELFLSTGRPYDSDFDWYVAKNTPESLLAAAMMLAGDEPNVRLREAMSQVAHDLNLHICIAKSSDNYTGRLALALIAAIAASRGV